MQTGLRRREQRRDPLQTDRVSQNPAAKWVSIGRAVTGHPAQIGPQITATSRQEPTGQPDDRVSAKEENHARARPHSPPRARSGTLSICAVKAERNPRAAVMEPVL